jgi:hypothetical protein
MQGFHRNSAGSLQKSVRFHEKTSAFQTDLAAYPPSVALAGSQGFVCPVPLPSLKHGVGLTLAVAVTPQFQRLALGAPQPMLKKEREEIWVPDDQYHCLHCTACDSTVSTLSPIQAASRGTSDQSDEWRPKKYSGTCFVTGCVVAYLLPQKTLLSFCSDNVSSLRAIDIFLLEVSLDNAFSRVFLFVCFFFFSNRDLRAY